MEEPARPRTLRALGLWFADRSGTAVVGALTIAGLAALGILLFGGSDGPEEPSAPSTQWLHERAAIARHGWRIAQQREADLRGVGEPSTILTLSPPAKSCFESGATRSQQIRIYDLDEGSLHRALTFEPKTVGCPPMEFEVLKVAPLIEYDSAPVVLGRFVGGLETFGEEVSVPIVIAWNDRLQRYSLRPLLVSPPRLLNVTYSDGESFVGPDRSFYQHAKETFERPVDLGSGLRGYAVSAMAVGRSEAVLDGPVLAGAYRLNAGLKSEDEWNLDGEVYYQRALWALETTPEGTLYAGECSLAGPPVSEGLDYEDDMAIELVNHADDLINSCAEY
jgi:hypothetical protein